MFYPIAAFAALLGGFGVAAAAASAHATANPFMATIAQMLMIHAAGAVGLLALGRGSPAERLYVFAAGLMVVGVALFSTDLAFLVFFGHRFFPYAAPIGGSMTNLAWLTAAVAGVLAWRRSRSARTP